MSDEADISTVRYSYHAVSFLGPMAVSTVSTVSTAAGAGVLLYGFEKSYDYILVPSAEKISEDVIKYQNSFIDNILRRVDVQ